MYKLYMYIITIYIYIIYIYIYLSYTTHPEIERDPQNVLCQVPLLPLPLMGMTLVSSGWAYMSFILEIEVLNSAFGRICKGADSPF